MQLPVVVVIYLSHFTPGGIQLALTTFRRFLEMLMFLYVRKYTSLFAKLIKTAEGFFERFIIANLYACQLYPPLQTVYNVRNFYHSNKL